jgi:replication-associated recombination protein RarA
MIPRTINNLEVFSVMSALQKHIRRNEEREAMACACEMGHTSKAYLTMLCNRLEVIAHEDIGLANPFAVMFTAAAVQQAGRHYDKDKPGKWRLIIGNVIRMLCRSPKSREGDHFQAAIGAAALLDGKGPAIPEYAYCMHTARGKRQGRGIDHFLSEATKLVPQPQPDAYAEEAAAVWRRKEKAKNGASDQTDLF